MSSAYREFNSKGNRRGVSASYTPERRSEASKAAWQARRAKESDYMAKMREQDWMVLAEFFGFGSIEEIKEYAGTQFRKAEMSKET